MTPGVHAWPPKVIDTGPGPLEGLLEQRVVLVAADGDLRSLEPDACAVLVVLDVARPERLAVLVVPVGAGSKKRTSRVSHSSAMASGRSRWAGAMRNSGQLVSEHLRVALASHVAEGTDASRDGQQFVSGTHAISPEP
jgi:hypothetical protein